MDKSLSILIAGAFFGTTAFSQPIEAKLDHVVIAVRDLEASKAVYSRLGFVVSPGGRHPGGTENLVVRFSAGGYLELISPYDATLPGGGHMAEQLKKGEGAVGAGLEITSAERAARMLTAEGLKIDGPNPGTIVRPDDKGPPQTRWWSLSFANAAASRPIFMIQYVRDPNRPPVARVPHPNSSFSISAMVVAVNDADKAAAGYGKIGNVADREIPLPEFGGVAEEIVLNKGSILLLHPTDPTGPAAQQLKDRGEGILGVRIGVASLDETREKVGEKNVSKDKQSVLVKPENAGGVWLQFQ